MSGFLVFQTLLIAACWGAAALPLLAFYFSTKGEGDYTPRGARIRLAKALAGLAYGVPLAAQSAYALLLLADEGHGADEPRLGQQVLQTAVAPQVRVERSDIDRLQWPYVVDAYLRQLAVVHREIGDVRCVQLGVASAQASMLLGTAGEVIDRADHASDRHENARHCDQQRQLAHGASERGGASQQRESDDQLVGPAVQVLLHLVEQDVVARVEPGFVERPFVTMDIHGAATDGWAEAEAAGSWLAVHSWASALAAADSVRVDVSARELAWSSSFPCELKQSGQRRSCAYPARVKP